MYITGFLTHLSFVFSDDTFLIDYVCRAIHSCRIPFCSIEDLPSLTITRLADEYCHNYTSPNENSESTINAADLSEAGPSNRPDQGPNCNNKKDVWLSKGKPTADDREATNQMLLLRASDNFIKKFNDKSSCKLNLWKDIACRLQEMGYNVDAKACRQKFANLQNKYLKFKAHVNSTGADRRDPPEFYDQLDEILGDKDKVTLNFVTDTLTNHDQISNQLSQRTNSRTNREIAVEPLSDIESEISQEDLLDPEYCQSNQALPNTTEQEEIMESRLTSHSHAKKKHAVTKSDIVDCIKQGQMEQRNQQETQFNAIMAAFNKQNALTEKQNQQRDEFLLILKDFLKPKRKRRQSSSESE